MSYSVYDLTVGKLQHLPEALIEEVSDFIDFLLMRYNPEQWQMWNHFRDTLNIAEADFTELLI